LEKRSLTSQASYIGTCQGGSTAAQGAPWAQSVSEPEVASVPNLVVPQVSRLRSLRRQVWIELRRSQCRSDEVFWG